ncbi:MAG: hypothetical protein QE276_02050 [Cyanobium sp. D14.bin.5]|nr:hypothetical protein [Cyanobium sp. D14.bin.5]
MSPVRGIPTSRAYWELKAEQVLNRVFEPEKPIEVEVCDTPAAFSNAGSIPVELHDLPPAPAKQPTSKPKQASAKQHPPRAGSALQRLADQVGRQPSLLLAGANVTVMVVAGMALAVLGLWNQSQQAIRQERNMLLIERLRTMGPGTTPAQANEPAQAASAVGAGGDGELPPPPPGEPWMEELATLPASSAPAADVLKVPINSRLTSPAPAATGSASTAGASASSGGGNSGAANSGGGNNGGGGNTPQLVGVVQVPGQSGSAIFQLGGSSTSAAVGESIGSSGWRLRSASGDTAVIEKGGEQRRISISSGF